MSDASRPVATRLEPPAISDVAANLTNLDGGKAQLLQGSHGAEVVSPTLVDCAIDTSACGSYLESSQGSILRGTEPHDTLPSM